MGISSAFSEGFRAESGRTCIDGNEGLKFASQPVSMLPDVCWLRAFPVLSFQAVYLE